ncbi:hypothetical protein FJ420_07255 [Mesorhizobium sp. B3-1-3]|uniref:hypothetical protein n=1 Tax=unclassified Mesorhizobium TaxID=325217 RepID=UPI00112850C3|nr:MULTISPECIES: hypothetical protein [unclassified Mesorhizobium]TPI62591.1 hypothetical protein FJ424_20730 [Mesorhizobium sp. B3-1-8]TPI74161.1 hypothetical protein FJ420_07255 [Mesorhizobium sp. B3-1-3]TPJ37078.1 hypothetical protein FJ418_02105 [Mesorhizobium sp. B2-8-3]
MRWPLIVIAFITGFILWDRFENDGTYTADVERSFREASLDMPRGWRPPTITINRDLLKR